MRDQLSIFGRQLSSKPSVEVDALRLFFLLLVGVGYATFILNRRRFSIPRFLIYSVAVAFWGAGRRLRDPVRLGVRGRARAQRPGVVSGSLRHRRPSGPGLGDLVHGRPRRDISGAGSDPGLPRRARLVGRAGRVAIWVRFPAGSVRLRGRRVAPGGPDPRQRVQLRPLRGGCHHLARLPDAEVVHRQPPPCVRQGGRRQLGRGLQGRARRRRRHLEEPARSV